MQDNKEEEKPIEIENLEEGEQPKRQRQVPLSRGIRIFIFCVLASLEGVINISTGILSSGSKEIKAELHMNDKQFGFFGTANSLGRVVGCTLFGVLNQKMSRKTIMVGSLLLKAFFCVCFKLTNMKYLLIIIRGCIGCFHMIPTIYNPVWITQFGLKNHKNALMSSIPLVQNAGRSLGYLVHIIVGRDNWQNGFVIEGVYLALSSFAFLMISENYFSRTLYMKDELNKNENRECTVFEDVITKSEEGQKPKKGTNYFYDLYLLSKEGIFLLGMASRCMLHGLNTGLHFWYADYMRNTLLENSSSIIFFSYTIVCYAGPVGGILGNVIFKPLIGGYESRKSSWPVVITHFISCLCGISISMMNSVLTFVIAVILYFIFNSIALPILQGILITSVSPELGATGFALTNALTQILASGPAPLMYGAINDKYKEKYPSLAMFCMMAVLFVALPILILLAYLRNKKFDKEEKEKNEKLVINNEEN